MTPQPKEYRYLKFVPFRDLVFWDYKSYFRPDATQHRYPTIELREVLTHRKKFITIDDTQQYKRCRVQLYAKGIVLRDNVKGKAIKTKKQQICRTEDFLVAEIDAKFGGYGIVPPELEDAIVSSHYFLFEVNQKQLRTDFFSLYLATEDFGNQVIATGSTNYAAIRPHHVLGYSLPLPPLDVQERLVAAHNARTAEANQCAQQATATEHAIERYIMDTLGIEITQKERKKGLQFVQFKDLERWDYDFLMNSSAFNAIKNSIYPVQQLGNLIELSQYGISDKASKEPIGVPMLRMNNIVKGELDLTDLKYAKLSKENLSKSLLIYGDLLFNRTNSKELVGKTAVFESKNSFVFASYLIRLRINPKLANVHFINYVMNSKIGRVQIDMTSRQVLGQANVNSNELRNFWIPLPPLDVQVEIVQTVNGMKAAVKALRAKAEALRREAKEAFEEELFV